MSDDGVDEEGKGLESSSVGVQITGECLMKCTPIFEGL